mmetsp:Transcript_25107/g.83746  ORF Transcript_25107/g.83746 Transcript_25107/m.83746 type:complete len:220 (+) Transcript_25107:1802-2461(+)
MARPGWMRKGPSKRRERRSKSWKESPVKAGNSQSNSLMRPSKPDSVSDFADAAAAFPRRAAWAKVGSRGSASRAPRSLLWPPEVEAASRSSFREPAAIFAMASSRADEANSGATKLRKTAGTRPPGNGSEGCSAMPRLPSFKRRRPIPSRQSQTFCGQIAKWCKPARCIEETAPMRSAAHRSASSGLAISPLVRNIDILSPKSSKMSSRAPDWASKLPS